MTWLRVSRTSIGSRSSGKQLSCGPYRCHKGPPVPSFDIISGDVVRAVSYCTVPGQVAVNSRDWQLVQVTGGTTISSGDFLIEYEATTATDYKAILSEEAQFYGTQLYKRTPVGPAPRPDGINVNGGPGT